jgi:hypothetical protein
MPIVNITGLKTRSQAKDYGAVDTQHKPNTKGGPAAANTKAPITSSDNSASNKTYNSKSM